MHTDLPSPHKPLPSMADTHAKRLRWWMELEPQWRAAFQYAFFRHADVPTSEEMESLWQTTALRFAGRKAPNSSMSFELTNCSGLRGMINLETLVLSYHQLKNVDELAELKHLKSLFIYNNSIQNLDGIKRLQKLEQLYAQVNQIDSLDPIKDLVKLREVYISLNALKTLQGLTSKHSKSLKTFVCLPNEQLPDREVIRVERTLGIRCRTI